MTDRDLGDFAAVFESHFDQVYGYVAYRLAPNIEAAADITQEVFVSGLKGWGTYRGDGSPLTWLRVIARRKVTDHFRSRSQGKQQLDAERLAAEKPAGPTERAALIAEVMQSLPADQAELLEEKYLEGLSVRQIAGSRSTTEMAVQSALFRARQAFREKFLRLKGRQETTT